MKLYSIILLLLLLFILLGVDARETNKYLQLRFGQFTLRVDSYGRDSLRVRFGPRIYDKLPGALIPLSYYSNNNNVEVNYRTKTITNGNIKATVSSTGLVSFTRISDNKVFLTETKRNRVDYPRVNNTFTWNVTYSSDEGEALYGLGQHQTGKFNNKNLTYDFQQCLIYDISQGAQIMIPFYISNKGYGYLWNLPSFGHFASSPNSTVWSSHSAYQLDYWVTTYQNKNNTKRVADILSNYVSATGRSPQLPHFASGFWQSKNRYRNETDLLQAARGYVDRGIPISLIVIDNIRPVPYGDFTFNNNSNNNNSLNCWPNPKIMTEELARMGIETMVSVWPIVQINSLNFQNFSNYFVKCPDMNDWCVIPPLPVYLIDATIPQARQLWWKYIKTGFIENGVTSFFLDSAEPVQLLNSPRHIYSIGEEETVGMLYPLYFGQVLQEGFQSERISGVSLIRSAWAGTQRNGAVVWSGDIGSNFQTLSQQVRVGLNMAMSGVAWWTTDIGGYFNGNIYDTEYRELLVRWFQWGAFCPIFRNHGFRDPLSAADTEPCRRSGASNEIWNFGEEAFSAIATVIRIREQLREYIDEHLAITSKNGTPIMRPLWFDFQDDPNCASIDDQLMFGPKYMVAPILQYLQRSRIVYFPEVSGKCWVHWFTREVYSPGTSVMVDSPLSSFPLFYLRACI